MPRGWILAILCCLSIQEAGDPLSEKAKLHEELAAAAEGIGDQLIKSKAWDEARAFLELIRAKSDMRADALDKLIAKTDKQTSGLKWDAKVSDLVKNLGRERAKGFFAFAKAWKAKDAEAARWTEAEAEILDDLLDYVKAYARLTQIRAHYELPKTRFDWKLSVPAVWHAKYLLQNPNDVQETEGKPGFSEEGRFAGKNSISNRAESLTDLVEAIIHAPFHRVFVLHPCLERTGLGQGRGAESASAIDVESGLQYKDPPALVLSIPKHRSTSVPTCGYDDHTRIVSGTSMKELGYPISLVFYNPTHRAKDISAKLTADLKDVEIYLSTPDKPALPKRYPSNKNSILLIPKSPLKSKTTYVVTVEYSVDGERKKTEWSFSTGS
jgi:hypothetical protein